MFMALVSTLILWILSAAGGYSLGKAWPQPGAMVAGLLLGLLIGFWWTVLRAGLADGVGVAAGTGFLFWLTALPALFVAGLASGAHRAPRMRDDPGR